MASIALSAYAPKQLLPPALQGVLWGGAAVTIRGVYLAFGATDTPMMKSSKADAGMGFQPVADVVGSIIKGIEADAFEVVRGGDARKAMLDLNRTDPAAIDQRFLDMKPALEAAVCGDSAR